MARVWRVGADSALPGKNRSFQWQLALRLLGMTVLVIGLNRGIAALMLENSLGNTIQQEIVLGLQQCADQISDRDAFYRCYRGIDSKAPSKYLIETFTVCAGDANDPPTCRALSDGSVAWLPPRESTPRDTALEFTDPQQAQWLGVRMRRGQHSATVAFTQARVRDYMRELWSVRDAILWMSLPPIFLAVILMSWYIMFWVMKPIHSIENALLELDIEALEKPISTPVNYQEFERIATIYQSLRQRLKDSYEKIRNFTADASHELKTPMTILRGSTEKLIAGLPPGSGAQIDALAITEEVERLITITEKLLLLSRADAKSLLLERAPWNLSAFLDNLADDASQFQSDVQVVKHIAPGIFWHCDPVLAKQLIHNLYTNASKYNIPGGRIGFALEQRDFHFRLTIENTSARVAEDLPKRAFNRFYRGDAARNRKIEGLGLGLSICREIAALHHGTLEMGVSTSSLVTVTLTAPLSWRTPSQDS